MTLKKSWVNHVATPYHIKVTPQAQRQIRTLNTKSQKIILQLAEALAINPRPPGAIKIEGMTGLYSHDLNPLRLLYKIEDQDILLLSIK